MGYTILIVEDNDDLRALAAILLQGAGYHVLLAGSGEDGLRLLGEYAVDLLIQDIRMPGINGWEVCRRLRADPRTAKLPVLVCSVRQPGELEEAETALADGFLRKPFMREELLKAVQQLIGG